MSYTKKNNLSEMGKGLNQLYILKPPSQNPANCYEKGWLSYSDSDGAGNQ
jgi:hypothetical protein